MPRYCALLLRAVIFAYALSGLIHLKGRNPFNVTVFLLSLAWTLFIMYGAFFRGGYPFNTKGLVLYLPVFFSAFGIFALIEYIRKNAQNRF